MSFPARCPGTCAERGTRFHVGDPITNADDDDDAGNAVTPPAARDLIGAVVDSLAGAA